MAAQIGLFTMLGLLATLLGSVTTSFRAWHRPGVLLCAARSRLAVHAVVSGAAA
jgi:hypothetical protein